ncbi:hypothetical protein WJX79_008739 [Trebouxia sp. C0005]
MLCFADVILAQHHAQLCYHICNSSVSASVGNCQPLLELSSTEAHVRLAQRHCVQLELQGAQTLSLLRFNCSQQEAAKQECLRLFSPAGYSAQSRC